jgi:hypothetical protein
MPSRDAWRLFFEAARRLPDDLAGPIENKASELNVDASSEGKDMNDNDPRIESSPLCRSVTHDGITVRVAIYRLAGSEDGWSLEVENQQGASIVWDDLFATDTEAFSEFRKTLETEGIRAFLDSPSNNPA